MRTYDALTPVANVVTPHLTQDEHDSLLDAINGVRAGEKEYYVLLTNRKVTKSRKRIADEDYVPHKALAPFAHKGWLVAAPTNQKGAVYLHVYDDARQNEAAEHGHTRISMLGIRSFEVLRTRSGPLAPEEGEQAPQLEQQVVPQPMAYQPCGDPRVMLAQAMFLQAQALFQMASYLTLTASQEARQPSRSC